MKKIFLTAVLYSLFICLTGAQEMTFYIIPSKTGINWESPSQLFSSCFKNMVQPARGTKKHNMGHVVIELRDQYNYALVGAAPKSKVGMCSKVLWGGYGFGALYHPYPGKMEEAEHNRPDIKQRLNSGSVAYLKMKISPEVFTRVWTYMEEYKQRGYDKIYNGGNRPRNGEGAGCSAFAVSFLEVAGLPLNTVKKDWIVARPVPEKMVGGPAGNNRFIHPLRIITARKWADTSKSKYRTISYYEPSLMYELITKAYDNRVAYAGGTPEATQHAKGFVYDYSLAQAPREPLWFTDVDNTAMKAGKSSLIKFD